MHPLTCKLQVTFTSSACAFETLGLHFLSQPRRCVLTSSVSFIQTRKQNVPTPKRALLLSRSSKKPKRLRFPVCASLKVLIHDVTQFLLTGESLAPFSSSPARLSHGHMALTGYSSSFFSRMWGKRAHALLGTVTSPFCDHLPRVVLIRL